MGWVTDSLLRAPPSDTFAAMAKHLLCSYGLLSTLALSVMLAAVGCDSDDDSDSTGGSTANADSAGDDGGSCGVNGMTCSTDADCGDGGTCLTDGTTGVCLRFAISCDGVSCPPVGDATCVESIEGIDPYCLTSAEITCMCDSAAGSAVFPSECS